MDVNKLKVPEGCKQLVVVVAEDTKSTNARLYTLAMDQEGWKIAGTARAVQIGRGGMVWGAGYSFAHKVKREGDGKTPMGIYSLPAAYGYAKPSEVLFTKMPYIMATDDLLCIDDPQSSHYNQLVSADIEKSDWNSFEHIKRTDALYKWGILVDYNTKPAVSSAGSCIFYHLWRSPESPTAGCTAMAEGDMLKLLEWLDPGEQPYCLQLTRSLYAEWAAYYGFPSLA